MRSTPHALTTLSVHAGGEERAAATAHRPQTNATCDGSWTSHRSLHSCSCMHARRCSTLRLHSSSIHHSHHSTSMATPPTTWDQLWEQAMFVERGWPHDGFPFLDVRAHANRLSSAQISHSRTFADALRMTQAMSCRRAASLPLVEAGADRDLTTLSCCFI